MPSTTVRERAVKAFVKAFPDIKSNKDLHVNKRRSKKEIVVSDGIAKISWSYKGGSLKRV
jgi:hypothetical protein